jgi:hypothetical protein
VFGLAAFKYDAGDPEAANDYCDQSIDAFQKKVRNERRDRRAARKQLAKILVMPSSGERQMMAGAAH